MVVGAIAKSVEVGWSARVVEEKVQAEASLRKEEFACVGVKYAKP